MCVYICWIQDFFVDWKLVLLLGLLAVLLLAPARLYSGDFVTGSDHSEYIRVIVSPGSASPGQLVRIWGLELNCGLPDCSDVVVVDSSGTFVPYVCEFLREINISNDTGTTLTDFQVRIELNAENFDFSRAKPDGSDVRFALPDGTQLPYWIEEWNAENQHAVVWVKVPEIPPGGTTIYMYYGNPSATSQSDGSAVFPIFAYADTGWDTTGYDTYHSGIHASASVQSDGLHASLNSSDNDTVGRYVMPAYDWELHIWGKITDKAAGNAQLGVFLWNGEESPNDEGYLLRWLYDGGNERIHISKIHSDTSETGLASKYVSDDPTVGGEMVMRKVGSTYYIRVGSNEISATDTTYSPSYIGLVVAYDAGVDVWYRYMYLRKYADPEPTAAVGPEVSVSLTFDPGYDGTWTQRDFFVLYGSSKSFSHAYPSGDIGDFSVSLAQPRDVVLYPGSSQHSVSPVGHEAGSPGDYNVVVRLFTESPWGVSRSVCDWNVHDPILTTVEHYHTDVRGDTHSVVVSMMNEGVYRVDYNCAVFFTEPISGSLTQTVYVPNPAVSSLSAEVSGVPSAVQSPTDVNVSIHVYDSNTGDPVPGATCMVDNGVGDVSSGDTNSAGDVVIPATVYPDTTVKVSCYKTGYHPFEVEYHVSHSTGGGTGGGGGAGAGGAAGGAGGAPHAPSVPQEQAPSVQQAAPVSQPGVSFPPWLLLVVIFVLLIVFFGLRR